MVHAPAQHFLRVFEHEPVMGGIAGEIVKFVGIILQIKKSGGRPVKWTYLYRLSRIKLAVH